MRDFSKFRKVEPTRPRLSRDPMGVPSGYKSARGTRVYFNAETKRLTITGTPLQNSDHNCDANGCGWEHVIAILDLSEQQAAEFSMCETTG